MARLPSTFNVTDSEKLGSYSVIPAGTYVAQIIKSEMKDTKNRDGQYLQLTFQIMEGEYVNRQLFGRLNLINQNPQTVEIANKALASIGDACGLANIEDTEQLHNIPMLIDVIERPPQGQYSAQNDIKNYNKYEGAVAASPTKVAAAANTKTPPWNRK